MEGLFQGVSQGNEDPKKQEMGSTVVRHDKREWETPEQSWKEPIGFPINME